MCFLTLLALVAAAGATTPLGPPAFPPPVPQGKPPPHSKEALRDLCRNQELCWQLVRTVSDGIMLLEVKFIHQERFLGEGDDFCDKREFWQIDAHGGRKLLATDCEEQWGPDSQGPVTFLFESAHHLRLSYLEWQTDDRCEKIIASLDWRTAKIVSARRWVGQAKDTHTRCVNLKVSKEPVQIGPGVPGNPVISFHRD